MSSNIEPFESPIYITKPLLPKYTDFTQKIKEIFDSKRLTNFGDIHEELKIKLKDYLTVSNISLFVNGTLSLEAALQVLGLEGEVITTPFTFPATTHAIARTGLTPVFCDIEEKHFNIDPSKIEDLISSNTTAILPVHVFGFPCQVEEIDKIAKKHKLKVIYDAAHAFGVKYKGLPIAHYGDVTMFSFHATKSFNTFEGGALSFTDNSLLEKFHLFKNFGIKSETELSGVGTNAKMNEVQAAMGVLLLDKLSEEVLKRKKLTNTYRKYLGSINGIKYLADAPNTEHTYQYFPILIDEKLFGFSRDSLYTELKRYNVFARKYFFPLCSEIDCYRDLPSAEKSKLSVAHSVAENILCLPLYGELKSKSVKKIADIIYQIQKDV